MPETPAPKPPVTPETIDKLLDLQTIELELRVQEVNLRRQELEHSAKYAEKSLAAQLEDRKDERQYQRSQTRTRFIAVGVFAVIVLVFAGYALYLNKDAIVLEVVKIVGSFAAGAFGGYAYARNRPTQTDGTKDDESTQH